jgi:HEAT repeat protein
MLHPFLLTGAAFAVLIWAALALYVVHIDRRRRAARAVVAEILAALDDEAVRDASLEARVERARPLLGAISRDMILHTAADTGTPRHVFEVLARHLVDSWGLHTLYREAAFHRASRDVWRRSASLKILVNLEHPKAFDLLAVAAQGPDSDIASVAFALLGTSADPRAVDILIEALKAGRHPASRIAVHLEHSPLRPVEAYRALLREESPTVRFWGATLLAQFPDHEWLEEELLPLTEDDDPRVRKAAIQTLGKVGEEASADAALRLLRDPKPFVRAHAARALAELDRTDLASSVADLLGDADWWVRSAAKQSLEMMGADVWPALMRLLDHPDGFVRNGAAEIFQNLGVLDNLIIMEAASDSPSREKIELLRRIATAGGTRMTTSLMERVGGATAPRVRTVLSAIGLEQAGTAS